MDRRLIRMMCALPLLMWGASLLAQDSGTLPELVVTATRSSSAMEQVPAAVTVVMATDIANQNVTRLGDALNQVPGLYLRGGAFGQSPGTQGTSSMSLRGIDQSRTLVLLDGQPLQDAGSGKVNWRMPFIEDIERIEVVPGAYSALYGSNAIGGVINIISKQPDLREFTARIKKGWGDAGGEDASAYFRGRMENGLGIAGGLGYQDRNSYVNEFVVKTPIAAVPGMTPVSGWQATTSRDGTPAYLVGDKGAAPWTSAHATLKLVYRLDGGGQMRGGIAWQETKQGYTRFNTYLRDVFGATVASGNSLNINGETVRLSLFDFVNNAPLHESALRYFVGYEGATGSDKRLKIDLARVDRAYGFTAASPVSPTYEGGAGTLTDTPNQALDGAIQFDFPAGEQQFWVTGLAFHGDEVNQKVHALAHWRDPGSRTSLNAGYNGTSRTTSVFGQDAITLGDTLTAYLGGRYDYWQTQGDYFNNLSASPPSAYYASRSDAAFSPKASLVFQPLATVTLRTSCARAFRAPPNLDLYSTTTVRCILDSGAAGNCTARGNPDLKPETGTSLELGGEWRFSRATQLGLTFYETRLNDLIYTRRVPVNEIERINAGKARVRGLELTARTRLSSWLALDANYAYIASEMLENAADPGSVGKRLTDSPQNVAGITLTAERGSWTGVLNARHVSHVYWTAQNTDVVEGVPGSYDAHTLVDVSAGYAFTRQVRLGLSINNLFDRKAYAYFLLPRRNASAELRFIY